MGDIILEQEPKAFIGDTEIVNVPKTTKFIAYGHLEETDRSTLEQLVRVADEGKKKGSVDAGEYFLQYRPSNRAPIPSNIFIGKRSENPDASSDITHRISLHYNFANTNQPTLVGYSSDLDYDFRFVNQNSFVPIAKEMYDKIVGLIAKTDNSNPIPHPETKAFARRGDAYHKTKAEYTHAGLVEQSHGVFKSEGDVGNVLSSNKSFRSHNRYTIGRPKRFERSPRGQIRITLDSDCAANRALTRSELNTYAMGEDFTLVAVHPYYLQTHNERGQRKELTDIQIAELTQKYDELFASHKGPLVIVEEEDQVLNTLQRIRNSGRQGEIYFVVTENRVSSVFPYTENQEFIQFLDGFRGDVKFVGGHDCGNQPYRARDPLTGQENTWSGCLRGLINRIEKLGFTKTETIPEYVYS